MIGVVRRRLAVLGSGMAGVAAASLFIQDQQQERRADCSLFSHHQKPRLVMSGDCGGTNTRLVLFQVPKDMKLQQGSMPPGLVRRNRVTFTNVAKGWSIDGHELERELGIASGGVKLINDFVAQGYGLLTLGKHETFQVNDAVPEPGAPIACIGAGTGLGECYLTAGSDGAYTCWPSEGGHAELAPRDEETRALHLALMDKFHAVALCCGSNITILTILSSFSLSASLLLELPLITSWQVTPNHERPKRVSIERVVSGPGLVNVYEFLRGHWAFKNQLGNSTDQAFLDAPQNKKAVVVAKGAANGNMLCDKAVRIFIEMYGSEAGVAALKWLPYGGLYISGGIAAKNPDWLRSPEFVDAFSDKGRLSAMVNEVPVFVVLTEDTGERGALFCATQFVP